jgi:phosphoribosyl 1,2-cyclic phosphate phosphodiesterase
MKWTILGSGGCMVIPKPLCQCPVCNEAREKGVPYSRTGPSTFLHDINLLIDTPAEVVSQLNGSSISRIDNLLFTHLDPDHVEGFRVVEQITLDFRSWLSYPDKQITLLLPESLTGKIRDIRSQYGPVIDFYQESGFITIKSFEDRLTIGDIEITALPVDRGSQISFVYIFRQAGKRVVYAPCDIKPFPEDCDDIYGADVLVIQPGIFEEGIKHNFRFPPDHISRKTLYTFTQTMELADRIKAREVIFIHMEEYWNRSFDDYKALESDYDTIRFAYDGMQFVV